MIIQQVQRPAYSTSRPPRRSGIQVLLVFLIAGAWGSVVLARSMLDATLMIIGGACLAVVAAPILANRNYQVVQPLSLVVILTFVGVTLKLWWFGIVGTDSFYVAERLLFGRSPLILLGGSLAMLAGLTAFVIGYSLRLPRLGISGLATLRRNDWVHGKLEVVCIALTVVAAAAFGMLIASAGIDTLSEKRFIEGELSSQSRLSSLSYLWFRIAGLARFPFYLAIAGILRSRGRTRLTLRGVALISGVVSLLLPLYSNNRAALGLIVLDILIISYLIKGRIRWRWVSLFLLAAFISVNVLLALRSEEDLGWIDTVQRTLIGRDFMDVTKTAHITQMDEMAPLGGETLVGWVVAPIPSSTWEGKPMWIDLGQYVWTEALGKSGSNSLPAGFVGELYLNIWWPGVVVGMLALGALLRLLYETFKLFLHEVNAVIIYVVLMVRLTIFTLSSDLGTGITKAALDVLPLVVLLALVGRLARRPRDSNLPASGLLQNAGTR